MPGEHNKEARVRVFRIESLNTYNGPGYRTVIYLKGCPLKCLWCHNPEGISANKEIWIIHSRCIRCQSCVDACPEAALSLQNNIIRIDREKCNGCYDCVEVCPSKAIEKLGEDLTVNELFRKILKDKVYFDGSGGGVTLTGGEPGTAPRFVASLFEKCRNHNIHTAFDTSGYLSEEALRAILPQTDLIFFDLKLLDEDLSKQMTGSGISKIIDSLNRIKSYIIKNHKPELQFRTPVIPGVTENPKNLEAIAELIRKNYYGLSTEWELNLFNDICADKYQRLDRKWNFNGRAIDAAGYYELEKFRDSNSDLNIKISGFIQKSKETLS